MIVEYGIRYQRMRQEWLDDLLAQLMEFDESQRKSRPAVAGAP